MRKFFEGIRYDEVFWAAVVVAIMLTLGTVAWAALSADGHITLCYVHEAEQCSGEKAYNVVGYRQWRDNIVMATTKDPKEAAELMATMCPGQQAEKP